MYYYYYSDVPVGGSVHVWYPEGDSSRSSARGSFPDWISALFDPASSFLPDRILLMVFQRRLDLMWFKINKIVCM